MQRVLVTGGAGFIGSHSVEALLANGMPVRVMDDFSTGRVENLPCSEWLEVVHGDIRDPLEVRDAMDGVTHVLHLAAQVFVQTSIEAPAGSCATNIQGFVNVLDAARRQGVKRVVYASSAATYGMPAQLPLGEDAPVRALSPYGLEKIVNDQYAELFGELYGLNCLGLRYFNVYGPRQDPRSPYAGVISKFIDCVRDGKALQVFGDGLQTRDFVFVKDVARANVAALRGYARGVCNVATGVSTSLLDLINCIAACRGDQLEVSFAPARDGEILHSVADIERLQLVVGLTKMTRLQDGLRELLAHALGEEVTA